MLGFTGFDIAYFDLETTDLKALMGHVLAGVVQDPFGNQDVFRLDHTKRESPIDDSQLVQDIRDRLETADMLVGWNSKLFDVPFLNARLMYYGYRPLRADMMHIDLMYYSKGRFMRIGSSKLDNVQKFFNTTTPKTKIEWEQWALASAGDPKAMDTVVEHCIADVKALSEIFTELKPNIKLVHR